MTLMEIALKWSPLLNETALEEAPQRVPFMTPQNERETQ